jgi:hypothetical protein
MPAAMVTLGSTCQSLTSASMVNRRLSLTEPMENLFKRTILACSPSTSQVAARSSSSVRSPP